MPFGGGAAAVPSPGQVVGGKYLIRRLLGEGGMAFVFEAFHQRLGQRVALKLLHPDFARDAEIVARFEREARALALLKSRHVARVTDVDATLDGLPYIVMEFLEGRDLDAELQARGHLPHEEAIDYVLQACAAMAEAHGAGIVHRDLKPANLFLAEDNGERIVKVLDFGISKVVGESTRLTGSGAVMGTVLYMSPEQVRATQDVDTRADIWSLGMILYELVAGRAPWEGASHQIAAAIVSKDAPDVRTFVAVPEPVATAIRIALNRDRNQRFPSVRELAAAIAPFAAQGSLGAAIADQLARGQSSPRMRPSYASISGAGPSMAMPMTMPMPMQPSLPPISSPHPSLAHVQVPPPPESTKPRTFVAIGAVLGVLAAIGVVLAFVAIGVRRQVAKPAPPPAAASAAAPEVTASAPAAASERSEPSPPSTGIETTAAASASAPTASAKPTAVSPTKTTPTAPTAASGTVSPTPSKSGEPPPFL